MAVLKNCAYDNVKIIHELCSLTWFIENHARLDYQAAHDEKALAAVMALQKDLEKHITLFNTLLHK